MRISTLEVEGIWRRNVPPKRRLISNGLNGDICQKTLTWIHLAQDKDYSWTPVNTAIELHVP
jgi:hypothetical protein